MKITLKINHLIVLMFAVLVGTNSVYADVTYIKPLNGREHKVGNILSWVTANEFNSQVFIVEKSIDGKVFTGIGEVMAEGISSAERGYRFLDVETVEPKSFYRLRQVDTDGTANYSQTILVEKRWTNDIMILSMSNTTTNDQFQVALDAMVDGKVGYLLKNNKGEIVLKEEQDIVFGINEIVINLKHEPEGNYIFIIKHGKEQEKLVIRKVNDPIQNKPNVASKSYTTPY